VIKKRAVVTRAAADGRRAVTARTVGIGTIRTSPAGAARTKTETTGAASTSGTRVSDPARSTRMKAGGREN
jgi:hypothetical protein